MHHERSKQRWTRFEIVAVMFVTVLALAAHPAPADGQELFGCDRDGRLFTVDVTTGVGTFHCNLPTHPNPGATEIEFDVLTNQAVVQSRDGAFSAQLFDIADCTQTGPLVFNGYAFNGLEYVGGVLYGTGIPGSCAGSELFTLDPATGSATLIGPTGLGPVAGLAWDDGTGTMYGITGCTNLAPSDLVTIDIATGAATVVGNTGVGLGSLEFGPDDMLYAGGGNSDGGNLYRVDTSDGSVVLVGATGYGNVTGLMLGSTTVVGVLDIRPGMCPNVLPRRRGVGTGNDNEQGGEKAKKTGMLYPVVVLGTDDVDVSQLDPTSLTLAGVSPADWKIADTWDIDCGHPGGGRGSKDCDCKLGGVDYSESCTCTCNGTDGRDDLILQIPGQELLDAIGATPPKTTVTLELVGNFFSGQGFQAFDAVIFPAGDDESDNGNNDGDGDVAHQKGDEGAVGFDLGGASPNPFNPVTRISFSLSQASTVRLMVYDVRGRLVEKLLDGHRVAGDHTVEWQADRYPSGIYFYRLQVGGFSQTRKMILLK